MEKLTPEQVEQQNKSLLATSQLLFGDSAKLQIVAPKDIRLLKENARFFKKSTFQQLTENIKKDKRLSSTPLCHLVDEKLEVLSGNHRVQAAINADIAYILVIVLLGDLEKSQKISIQLSHNALVGEDDKQILANLWAQIDDITEKCYAGLSSSVVGDLEKINLVNFSTPAIKTKQLTFSFTEIEHESIQAVLDELSLAPGDSVYLCEMSDFDDFFQAIQKVKKLDNIKNGSLALRKLIETASTYTAREEN